MGYFLIVILWVALDQWTKQWTVANMTIVEIKETMPRSFVPQYAIDLFEEMICLLNRKAKEVAE